MPVSSKYTEKNKEVVRQILEAFNTGNAGIIDGLISPQVVSSSQKVLAGARGEEVSVRGLEGVRKQVGFFQKGFSNLRFEEVDLVAEGDTVVLCWKMTGTNTGPIFGRQATGKQISHHGAEIVRLKDGVVVEHSDLARPFEFLEKLGLLDESMLQQVRSLEAKAALERNKATVRQVLNAFNTGDTEVINNLISQQVIDSSAKAFGPNLTQAELSGFSGVQRQIGFFQEAFPKDLRFEEVDLVAEGDTVILCWKMTGTNTGPIFGQKATGKYISHHGVEILHLKDGLIVEHSDLARPLEFVDKLGLLDDKMLKSLSRAGVRSYEP